MDVTVHESDGRLRRVYKASESTSGSIIIDDGFIHMMENIFGRRVFRLFQEEEQLDYHNFLMDFELKIRNYRWECYVSIRIPGSLLELHDKCTHEKGLKEAIEESVYNGKIRKRRDRFIIDADTFTSLFKPYNDAIVHYISNLLEDEEIKGIEVLLLVGGLSECVLVQECIRKSFPNLQILIPYESALAVLKGAVFFGQRPLAISSRVSKYSYGLGISPLYDPSIHPENRRVIVGSTHLCRDVFMKFFACGETVRIGDARFRKLSTLWPYQQKMTIKLYVSSNPNPKYVDEKGTEYLGNILVDIPDNMGDNVVVKVSMTIGETELTVEATEMSRRKEYRADFYCL